MKHLTLLLFVTFLLTGCANSGALKALIEQAEFEEGERGCVEISGNVNVSSNPLVSTNVSVVYKKDTGDGAPSC